MVERADCMEEEELGEVDSEADGDCHEYEWQCVGQEGPGVCV